MNACTKIFPTFRAKGIVDGNKKTSPALPVNTARVMAYFPFGIAKRSAILHTRVTSKFVRVCVCVFPHSSASLRCVCNKLNLPASSTPKVFNCLCDFLWATMDEEKIYHISWKKKEISTTFQAKGIIDT